MVSAERRVANEKKKERILTEGVRGRAVLENLVRLEPLRDRGSAGLRGDGGEQDSGDGRHGDAAVNELWKRVRLKRESGIQRNFIR